MIKKSDFIIFCKNLTLKELKAKTKYVSVDEDGISLMDNDNTVLAMVNVECVADDWLEYWKRRR